MHPPLDMTMASGRLPLLLLASTLTACAAFGVEEQEAESAPESEPPRVEGVPKESPTAPPPHESPRTISFFQDTSASFGSTTSAVVNLPQSSVPGDLVVVAIGWFDTTATVKSVTDSGANTYQPASNATRLSSSRSARRLSQQIFFAPSIATASRTVTINWNSDASNPDIRVAEFRGLDRTKPFTKSIVTTTTNEDTRLVKSADLATTNGPTLLFAGMTTQGLAIAGDSRARQLISREQNLAHWMIVDQPGTHSLIAEQTLDREDDDGPGNESITEILAFR